MPSKQPTRYLTSRRVSVRKRVTILVGLIALQGISAAFFVGDVFVDLAEDGFDAHSFYEAQATLALVLGVVFGTVEMWRTVARQVRAETALRLASGAFGEMIEEKFEHWSLSAAEADVALMTLKGFEADEIAQFRDTSSGTVRVQLSNVYAKSGLHNRGQFVSSFLDDLLDNPLARPSRMSMEASTPD